MMALTPGLYLSVLLARPPMTALCTACSSWSHIFFGIALMKAWGQKWSAECGALSVECKAVGVFNGGDVNSGVDDGVVSQTSIWVNRANRGQTGPTGSTGLLPLAMVPTQWSPKDGRTDGRTCSAEILTMVRGNWMPASQALLPPLVTWSRKGRPLGQWPPI